MGKIKKVIERVKGILVKVCDISSKGMKMNGEEERGKDMVGIRGWIGALNRIKMIAIVVVNCFLLTAVYGQAVAGILESQRATEQFKQVFEDIDVPYSYGKITQARYKGSDKVFINIQDLHSHSEVQKNISNIIEIFDNKYGVKNVYLEGAYGEMVNSGQR